MSATRLPRATSDEDEQETRPVVGQRALRRVLVDDGPGTWALVHPVVELLRNGLLPRHRSR